MSELKFRAWAKKRKGYRELDQLVFGNQGLEEVWAFPKDNETQQVYHPSEVVIEQYSGLKDKNGKEIYEGDIVKITRELTKSRTAVYIYQIKYDVSRAAFTCWKNNHFSCMFFESNEGECEVIGNIHEPPKDFRLEHLKRMGVSISKGGEE